MREPRLVLHPKRRVGIGRVCRRRVGNARGVKVKVGDWEWWVLYLPYRGWVARAVRQRGTIYTCWFDPIQLGGTTVKKKTTGGVPSTGSAMHLAPVDSDILSRLPAVVAHMAVTRYDDGDSRRPGWVTISTLGSSWKVVAKDPDAAAQCTALGGSLDDALSLLELLLASEEAPWEPDSFLAKGRKK